jgi:hypothetical protein
MQIGVAVDNTVPLYLPAFIDFFQAHSKKIRCRTIDAAVRFSPDVINYDNEIARLSPAFRDKLRGNDVSILATTIRYENNYFYDGKEGSPIIVSLSGWHQLTNLPMSNGLAFIICQHIVKFVFNIGKSHDDRTGCINDFLWDKTGIDTCMKTAFICDECKQSSIGNPYLESEEYTDIVSLLDAISLASRRGADILYAPTQQIVATPQSRVFLCHNNQDKEAVRILNETLQDSGIATWFDEEQINPGDVWQDKLEAAIDTVSACIVVVGDSGFGPWQDMERRAFINEFANRGCKIVPVLIGKTEQPPKLPLFLSQMMWVDLRAGDPRQVARLLSALRS